MTERKHYHAVFDEDEAIQIWCPTHEEARDYVARGETLRDLVELHPWETIVTREQAAQYAGFRHVEPGGRVLTAEENAAVLRLLVALKAWRHDGYQTGHWPHLGPIAHALESLPASLLAAAKETKP